MKLEDIKFITKGYFCYFKAILGIGNKKVEALYLKRLKICLPCLTISNNKLNCSKEKGGCGCPLSIRLRSEKGCPKGYWK